MELLPCEERVIGTARPRFKSNKDWSLTQRNELAAVRKGRGKAYISSLSALGDAEALAFFNACEARWFHGGDYDARELEDLVQRLGIRALPGLLRYADGKLPSAHLALSSVVSPRVAPYLAEILAKGKKRERAEAWFLENPEVACIGLIPASLETNKKTREHARNALRFLQQSGHGETVARVAEKYGVTLDVGADAAPARVRFPAWLDTTKFDEHERSIVALLQASSPQITHSDLIAERGRAKEIAWKVFEQWREAGEPSKDEWALFGLGHLGDDEIVERLLPFIPRWQANGASQRAAKALEVLALIGTDLALSHLDQIARKGRTQKLRRAATRAIERISKRMQLSVDELEDRRAPDLGLDERGRIDLEFEGWSLTLDEHLAPRVVDPQGHFAKKLPRGAPTDELKQLKKNAALVAESQLARFERALVTQRTWTPEAFAKLVKHPLLHHLAHRLVWMDGRSSFRVTEDRTYADVEDRPYEIDGNVRIAHPIELGASVVDAWSRAFEDYEILQPFPQLARPAHARSEKIVRLIGLVVPWHRVLALRGFVGSGSDVVFSYTKEIGNVRVEITVTPGISRADPRTSGDQTITHVTLSAQQSELGAITFSEIMLALDPLR